jgi:hypothetical protein
MNVPTCIVIGKPARAPARRVRDLADRGTPLLKTDLSGRNLLAMPTNDAEDRGGEAVGDREGADRGADC